MRFATTALFLFAIHCGGTSTTDDAVTGDDGTSSSSEDALSSGKSEVSGCEESRLVADAPDDRRDIIRRAFGWLHEDVPYSQSAFHPKSGYRTDCSGFISMTWQLGAPGLSTYNFAPNYEHRRGDKGVPADLDSITHPINWSDLTPGDAASFSTPAHGHVVLFLGYRRGSRTVACTLEQQGIQNDMVAAAYDISRLKQIYTPIRAAKFD